MNDRPKKKKTAPAATNGKTAADSRNITYRVGWKSGTIQLKPKAERKVQTSSIGGRAGSTFPLPGTVRDPGAAAEPAAAEPRQAGKLAAGTLRKTSARSGTLKLPSDGMIIARTAAAEKQEEEGVRPGSLAALLLRPAPQPTLDGWRVALAVLPVAVFAALLWLASRLSP